MPGADAVDLCVGQIHLAKRACNGRGRNDRALSLCHAQPDRIELYGDLLGPKVRQSNLIAAAGNEKKLSGRQQSPDREGVRVPENREGELAL
jgi:hypothetical protein